MAIQDYQRVSLSNRALEIDQLTNKVGVMRGMKAWAPTFTETQRRENRAVAENLKQALREAYGSDAAEAAFSSVLKKDHASGKKVKSRHVKAAIKEAQKHAYAKTGEAYGLKYMGKRGSIEENPLAVRRSGVDYDTEGIKEIGPYIHKGTKRKGREPGFEGAKRWKASDTEKLFKKGHKFAREADLLLNDMLDLDTVSPVQKQVKDKAEQLGITDRKELLTELKKDPEVFQVIKRHIQSLEAKFSKKHYVKLDYKESKDVRGTGLYKKTVKIPIEKANNWFHRFFTKATAYETNLSAVRECLANDLTRAFGVFSQKLKLVPSQYSDGTPKLLLDGTHMTGPNGESFEDFGGRIKDGVLVDKDGQSDRSVKDLGKYKIFMLLLADRDALGSRGDNKGRTGNLFAGIDPGHSLEDEADTLLSTDLMSFKNVHSDLSFDQPSKLIDRVKGGYKNFTIFDDTPYLEKMEGVRELFRLRESGADLDIFDQYLGVFNGKTHELDFSEQIHAMRERYIARRDYILDEVFAERLKFIDTTEANADTALAQLDSAQPLTIVDGLEKLTSKTTLKSAKGEVELNFLQTVKRQEWHISPNTSGNITLYTEGKNLKEVETALRGFIHNTGINEKVVISKGPKSMSVIIRKDDIEAVSEAFKHENVKIFKTE
tara:strand:+ start:56917 stop:58893 length:1977 start_codon:yes stop_codon:yes gene_type:complete